MIPEKTLEIIQKEANELYPNRDKDPDIFTTNDNWVADQQQKSAMWGAKLGYELAIKELGDKYKHNETKFNRQKES